MHTPDKLLSVIIPTYNMERYLRYCLDSLLIKENFEALEVLVINDGSKDSSSIIAHEYADRYQTVFRVIDKENGNYGSCINRGLKEATGKYIKVLDADDSFDTIHFEEFVVYLMHTDADLILSDFAIVNEERKIVKYHRYDFEPNKQQRMEAICTTPIFKDMEMHAVTYRRSIFNNIEYYQTEGISYTDQQWIFMPMLYVKNVCRFDKHVYNYLVGREGQTISAEVRQKSMSHITQCIYDMIDAYNKCTLEMRAPIKEYLHARLIPLIKDIYITSFTYYSAQRKENLIIFDKTIKEMNNDIYKLVEETNARFNYIGFWRKHTESNIFLVRTLTKIYQYFA